MRYRKLMNNIHEYIVCVFSKQASETSVTNNNQLGTRFKFKAVEVKEEIVKYGLNFAIEKTSYALELSFTKSDLEIVGSLSLKILEPKSSRKKSTTEEVPKENESSSSGENTDNHLDEDQQDPCAIWANLIGSHKKIHTLTKSSSDHSWKSDKFNGGFAFGLVWKPITCMLWIEFETCGKGEKTALKQLTELYVQQNQCDVQFYFEGGEKIGGHVYILSARSSVFAAMFHNDMQESKTGKVDIKDVQPEIFKQLLHYIYSGRISTPLTEYTARPLFVAADKYDVEDLRNECILFLLSSIRIDNAISLMVWANLHSVDELKNAALTFTARHGKQICLMKDWDELTKNYPELSVLVVRRILEAVSLIPDNV